MPKKRKRTKAKKTRKYARKRRPPKRDFKALKVFSAVSISTALLVIVTTLIGKVDGLINDEYETGVLSRSNVSEVLGEDVKEDEDPKFTLALMADSEDDLDSLQKALDKSSQEGVDSIIFLGDYTSWGDTNSLNSAKKIMDGSGITYFSIPGDHDLADSVQNGDISGQKNFGSVFGDNHHTLELGDTKIVILDNSANYSKISDDLIEWFYSQIKDADLVILSQPVYHPTFNRSMGVVDGVEVSGVKTQADEILEEVRKSEVKAIVAADYHFFSRHEDPEDNSLEHIVVGALSSERNLQTPRFCLLHIMENGSYEIEEVVL